MTGHNAGRARARAFRLGRYLLAACGALVLGLAWVPNASADWDSQRERAVELAREGRYQEALERLERLPAEPAVIHDRIAVAFWAGDYDQAWRLRGEIVDTTAPDFVLAALARSAREQRRLEGAGHYYRLLDQRFPQRSDGPAGLAMTLADSGHLDPALATVHAGLRRFPDDAEMLFAAGYVHRVRGEVAEAIGAFRDSLAADPSRDDAFGYLVGTASLAGAARPALVLIEGEPGRAAEAELRQALADRAALAVRWGAVEPERVEERFAATDRAIALLEENLRRAEAGGASWEDFARLARFDLIVALRDRQRMEDVLELYDSIAEEAVVPGYVIEAVGNALQYLQRPREAVEHLERALALQAPPGRAPTRLALFYALIESERHDEAQDVVDALVEDTPEVFVNPRTNLHFPNPDRRDAELHAALARLFADRPDLAAERIEALSDAAPFHPGLRAERANVYRARGWHTRALEEARIGLSTEPEHVGLRVNEAASLLELGFTGESRERVQALAATYPEHRGVERLAERQRARDGSRLSIRARATRADGGELGTRSRNVEGELYSPLVRDRFRVFALGQRSVAEFETEGRIVYERGGLGVSRESPDGEIAVAATANRARDDHAALLVRGRWRLNDQWRLGASADSHDPQTPLRALNEDIRARTVAATAEWNAHESRGATVELRHSDFTDGNRRRVAGISWREDLVSGPRYHLRGYADVYASDNTREGAPYFNPDDDLTASVTLRNQWRTWRRYQRTFEQVLALTGGQYWQAGFDRGPIGALRYEHRWQRENRLELIYGITRAARRFDGEREDETEIFGRMDWSF